MGADQPSSADGGTRGGRAGGKPIGRCDRQPVGEDDRGRRAAGYDAGKKIKGRKRHIVTDTMGLLVAAIVHAAGIQDRDGAVPLLASIRSAFPWLQHIFADGGYAGDKLKAALARLGRWTLAIVKRAAKTEGFQVLPRRWVVERTLAWLNRNRRLAKDFEASIASAESWIMMASVKLLSRRLVRT
jgi:transposase